MSVIYTGITAGSAATQARPADYFAGVKESLSQMQADKDKKNQDKLDSLASIPNLSTTNMWDSHFQVAKEMDENLRDTLEEASESPESMAAWERRLQQRMDFVAESEAYYKNTAATLIQRAEIAGNPTLNPKELREAGKIDSNTREHYEAEMARLDDIGQFSGVTVSGGRFVLPNNTPLLGIFDDQVELIKPNLVDMDFQRPEGWWSSHVGGKETDVTDLEAKNYIIGIIEDDEVEKQAAVNWYVETSGADRDKVDKNVAIDAYAEAAAKGRVKAKADSKKDGKKDSEKLPAYLNDGLFSIEPVPDDVGEGVLTQEELDARDPVGHIETYTLKTPISMEGTKMTKITYDTTSEPMQWVVSFANGNTIEIPEEYDSDIGKFVPGSIPDNNAGSANQPIYPHTFFDAKNSKEGAFAETLMEIRERALRGS